VLAMKCAMLFALVVAAAATQAPVISLDLSTLEDFERLTNHKSKTLGLEVNNKNVGAYQDYVARCPAGADQSFKTCPMPKANAYDHNDQKVKVTKSVWRVDLEGSKSYTKIASSVIDFKKRGAYLFKFNSQDKAGNKAEEVVFALLVDDLEKPTVSCDWKKSGEAGHKMTLDACTATDNVEKSPSITYTIAGTDVLNKNYAGFKYYINGMRRGTFKVTVTANDNAGHYGRNAKSNTKSATYTFTTKDTVAPVIKVSGKDPTTTECAKGYNDAGASATDLVDKNVRVTSSLKEEFSKIAKSSNVLINVGGENTWTSGNCYVGHGSGVKNGATSGVMTDGVTESRKGYWHSCRGSGAWAKFRLPYISDIDSVSVWNRADCCEGRIHGATASLVDVNGKEHKCSGTFTNNGKGAKTTVKCPNVAANYIVVRSNGRHHLHFSEVTAAGNRHSTKNLLLNVGSKNTWTSGNCYVGHGSGVKNGATTDTLTDGTIDSRKGYWHSCRGSGSWAKFRLSGASSITSVEIFNRGDCCEDRINGVTASLVDVDGKEHKCSGTFKNHGRGTPTSVNCDQNVNAAYVIVRGRSGAHLHFSEARAFGKAHSSLDTSKVGTKVITYNAKDFSGNKASPVTRHVKIVDTTNPYSIKFTDGTDRQTVIILKGYTITHPKIVCEDTCDNRFSYSSKWAAGNVPPARLGKSTVAGTYKRIFTCRDPSGNERTITRHYIFQDKQKPVINIVGYEKLRVEADKTETYNDAGATCYDAHDGTLKVKTYGTASSKYIKTSTITYKCCDAAGNCATAKRFVTTSDTRCPKIELIGAAKVFIEAQGKYSEQGATIVDSFYADKAASFYGRVNTKAPATYTVTYHGKDQAGNAQCAKATRQVVVQDTLPPVITLHLKGKVVAKSASASHNAAGTAAGNPFIRFPRFMEQAINNGWVMAAAASAVMGVALLATSSKTDVSVPV